MGNSGSRDETGESQTAEHVEECPERSKAPFMVFICFHGFHDLLENLGESWRFCWVHNGSHDSIVTALWQHCDMLWSVHQVLSHLVSSLAGVLFRLHSEYSMNTVWIQYEKRYSIIISYNNIKEHYVTSLCEFTYVYRCLECLPISAVWELRLRCASFETASRVTDFRLWQDSHLYSD